MTDRDEIDEIINWRSARPPSPWFWLFAALAIPVVAVGVAVLFHFAVLR